MRWDEYFRKRSNAEKEALNQKIEKQAMQFKTEWEKKYGYKNKGHVVLETKSYPVDSKGRLIVV